MKNSGDLIGIVQGKSESLQDEIEHFSKKTIPVHEADGKFIDHI